MCRGKRPKLGHRPTIDGNREVLALLRALEHVADLISQLALCDRGHATIVAILLRGATPATRRGMVIRFADGPAGGTGNLRGGHRRRDDQHGGRQRHAVHVSRAARVRVCPGGGQRVQHGRVGARVGVRRDRLPPRAQRAAPARGPAGDRVAAGRDRRRGAPAEPAGIGVQGDRVGVHRDRAGADRAATAP